MKLVNKTHEKYTFELLLEEKDLLIKILQLYPSISPSNFELSKTIKDDKLGQSKRILQDALKEHQLENKRLMHELFQNPDVLKPKKNPDYYTLELNSDQVERLLQVLNDIRIGTWRMLGCPDFEKREEIIRSADDILFLYTMDICEYFEYYILKALGY